MKAPWMPVWVVLATLVHAAVAPAEELSPVDTVKAYLTAFQDQDFDRAWELSSKAMRGDKTKEAWVRERQFMFQLSETKIFDFQTFDAAVEGDKAFVPNILSSQDKFLNQLGVEEYELYTLLKEDGAWRVDQQEVVIDQAGLEKWFPADARKSATGG